MLGDIVHNENVVKDLEEAGAKVVDKLDDIPKDKPVLLRAHGTIQDTWKNAKKKNLNIIDATCPLVHEIHREVKMLEMKVVRLLLLETMVMMKLWQLLIKLKIQQLYLRKKKFLC